MLLLVIVSTVVVEFLHTFAVHSVALTYCRCESASTKMGLLEGFLFLTLATGTQPTRF